MAVLCGWASIDERGKASGGKAGDQTGREVKTGNWYYFKQKAVYRFKDRTLAKKYAKVIKFLCESNLVGYDQSQRTTCYNALAKLNWKYTKLKEKCETDCSDLVATALCVACGKKVISSAVYTGNLGAALMATGLFLDPLTGSKYTTGSDYLMTGDILNDPGHHVISVLADGPKAGVTSAAESKSVVAESTLRKGSVNAEVKKLQRNLNTLKFTDASGKALVVDGEYGASTYEAVKKFQSKYKLTVDGIYGPKSEAKMKTLIK